MSEDSKIRFRVKPYDKENVWNVWFQPGRVYEGVRVDNKLVSTEDAGGYSVSVERTCILEEPEPKIELHQSDVDALWACPRRFYYQSIMGLQVRKRPDYFLVGEIYHYGVGVMRFPFNATIVKDRNKRFDKTKKRIQHRFGVEQHVTEALSYLEQWNNYDKNDPIENRYEPATIEVPLTYRSSSWPDGFAVGGSPDSILVDVSNPKRVWIGEWKTARIANISYFRSLKNGPQPAWYYVLLLYNLPWLGLEETEVIRGHVYEVLCKAGPDSVKRETAILDDGAFRRGLEFLNDSVYRAHELIEKKQFPRVLTACYGKFNTECPYMPWCYRGGEPEVEHADLLSSMYNVIPPSVALRQRQTSINAYALSNEPEEEA